MGFALRAAQAQLLERRSVARTVVSGGFSPGGLLRYSVVKAGSQNWEERCKTVKTVWSMGYGVEVRAEVRIFMCFVGEGYFR
jgi:hypothetical protein